MKLSTCLYGMVASVALAAVAHLTVFHDMRRRVDHASEKVYHAHLSFLTTLDAVKDTFALLHQNATMVNAKEIEEQSTLLQALVKRLGDYGNLYFEKNAQSFQATLQNYINKLVHLNDGATDRRLLEAEIKSLGTVISTQLTFVERTQLSATEDALSAIQKRRNWDDGILMAVDSLCILMVGFLVWYMRKMLVHDLPIVHKMLERLQSGDLSENALKVRSNEMGTIVGAGEEVGENLTIYIQKFAAASAALDDIFNVLKVANIRVNEETATSILSVQKMKTLGAETLGKFVSLSEQIGYVLDGAEATIRYLGQTHKVCDSLGILHDQVGRDTTHLSQIAENLKEGIKSLEHVFQEILSAIKSVDELSEQTKLLSLNATIEAKSSEGMPSNVTAIAREIRALVQKTIDVMREMKAKFNDGCVKLKSAQQQISDAALLSHGLSDASSSAVALFEGQHQAGQEGTTVVQVVRHAAGQSQTLMEEVQVLVKEIVCSVDGMQTELKKFESDAKKMGHYVGSVQQVSEELRLALRAFTLP